MTAVAPVLGRAPLGREGRRLTDAAGRTVVLHGVNVVNKRPPYHPAALGFDERHAAFIAAQGWNTVRLGIIWRAAEPRPGLYDDAYLDAIAETAALLARHGQHVLVDLHQDMFHERYGGEGFPDWALPDGRLPPWPDLGFPGNYALMPALWRAYDRFWRNAPAPDGTGLLDRCAALWGHVAARLREVPGIIGYDLLNEPFPGSLFGLWLQPWGVPPFDRGPLARLTRRCLRAIRAHDAERLVFYEPSVLFNNGVRTHHPPTGDPRTGFSFHLYAPATTPGLPRLRGPWQDRVSAPFERRVLANALAHTARTETVPLISEFGAIDDGRAIRRVCDAADAAQVGWQFWAYWNADPSAPRPEECIVRDLRRGPVAGNLAEEKLDALVRPFPRAIAGTPTVWRLDRARGVLRLSYRPGRGGPTEVWVADRWAPDGYELRAGGARAVSEPGAERLLLRADDEAGVVEVEVRRR